MIDFSVPLFWVTVSWFDNLSLVPANGLGICLRFYGFIHCHFGLFRLFCFFYRVGPDIKSDGYPGRIQDIQLWKFRISPRKEENEMKESGEKAKKIWRFFTFQLFFLISVSNDLWMVLISSLSRARSLSLSLSVFVLVFFLSVSLSVCAAFQ